MTRIDLEFQLEKVIERDGALMFTPRGMTRMARRVHIENNFLSNPIETRILQDEISVRDHASAVLFVTEPKNIKQQDIPIRFGEHPRSAFVVSLRSVAVTKKTEKVEREFFDPSFFSNPGEANELPVEVYSTMSSDLYHEDIDHRFILEQFTPATFEESYLLVYGYRNRLHSRLQEWWTHLSSILYRTKRVAVLPISTPDLNTDTVVLIQEIPHFSFIRTSIAFAVFALITTLPVHALSLYKKIAEQKNIAMHLSLLGVQTATAASTAESIPEIANTLRKASSRFQEADAILSGANALAIGIASAMPSTYRSSRALLEAGDKSSQAAALLATGLDKVLSEKDRHLDERLDVLHAYAENALVLIDDATHAVMTIDETAIPNDITDKVRQLKLTLEASKSALSDFSSLAAAASVLVGRDGMRNYLLIFQNQTELRPTGGFMGSFAEITMDRGQITKINIPSGGTYDLQGELRARVTPPKPLQLVQSTWQFQDANWNPDFPSAAKKIEWFWNNSGEPTIDGVIAINANMVQKLLAVTGPIDMPEYGRIITEENFIQETQKAVELDYDIIANTPKKIIGDLQKKIMEKAKTFTKEQWVQVAGIVVRSLDTKDIQVYFTRDTEEALAERYGWSNRLKSTVGDSLAIVYANIAGQKTDKVIEEHVKHVVHMHEDGSIIDTAKITRIHRGNKGEIFQGVRNVGYMRVYVPKGSTLISASGFNTPEPKWFQKIDDSTISDPDIMRVEQTASEGAGSSTIAVESDRTVFGGWVQLDPGHSQEIELTYTLPFTAKDILSKVEASPESASASHGAYVLLLTSQPGKPDRTIQSTVAFPKNWDISWTRGVTSTEYFGYSGAWDHDIVLASLLHPHEEAQANK